MTYKDWLRTSKLITLRSGRSVTACIRVRPEGFDLYQRLYPCSNTLIDYVAGHDKWWYAKTFSVMPHLNVVSIPVYVVRKLTYFRINSDTIRPTDTIVRWF